MTHRSPKSLLRRAACGLGAVGLAAVGFTAPAEAQETGFTLGSSPAEVGLYPHPASGAPQAADFEVWIDNPSEDRFPDVPATYTIDLTGIQGVADWEYGVDGPVGDCEAEGAVVTCTDWGVWSGRSTVAAFRLTAAQGSSDGDSGTVTVSGEVDGTALTAYTAKVSVGGPDLVAQELPAPGKVEPGDVYNAPLVFANAGTQAADGVLLTMRATHGVEFMDRYENCEYSSTSHSITGPGTVVICEFDEPIGAGEIWAADPPERLRLAKHALYDEFGFHVSPNTAEEKAKLRGGLEFSRGEGPALTLKQRPTPRSADLDPWNNMAETAFQVQSTADFAARGVQAEGAAGETVKVDLGWQNKGPAWVGYVRSGEDVAQYEFLVPEGAEVTKKPQGCRATKSDGGYLEDDEQLGAPRYVCSTGSVVLEDEKFSYPFELKIEKVVAGAAGKLTVGSWTPESPKPHPFDGDHKNNAAKLVLNGTGGSGGGDTGGTGGSEGGSGDDGGSTGGAETQSTGGSGGGLASTGTSGMLLIGGAAASVVALGGTLFVLARRRSGTAV